jgi:hypothetical protein
MDKIKYSKSELEGVIRAVETAENSDSMYVHSWARCAKILASECVTLRADLSATNKAVKVLEVDMHNPSKRPCKTCQTMTDAFGFPFGCNRLAKDG